MTRFAAVFIVLLAAVLSCTDDKGYRAPAVNEEDSAAFMRSWGISTLISDSGVMRYKITAETWDIYNVTNPPKWVFINGILLEKFDSVFHIDWFVQSDTAYCYNQKLWELRGRVVIRNLEGTLFTSEELFWNMDRHELYSNLFMTIRKPDELLQGYNFRSNERMTRYSVSNANGETPYNESAEPVNGDTVQLIAPTVDEESIAESGDSVPEDTIGRGVPQKGRLN